MARVEDVAAYILMKLGGMDTWKLQKLVYYCQAWSLVWDERPLFSGQIQAWANGPVSVDLYNLHKGQYTVASIAGGDPGALSTAERETVDAVIEGYGSLTGAQLSELTHRERPWRETRAGFEPGEKSTKEIPLSLMSDFYTSIYKVE